MLIPQSVNPFTDVIRQFGVFDGDPCHVIGSGIGSMNLIFVISTIQQIHLVVLSGVGNPTDFIFESLELQIDAGSVTIIKCISSGLCCQFPHSCQHTTDIAQATLRCLNQVVGLLNILISLFHALNLVGHSGTDG